ASGTSAARKTWKWLSRIRAGIGLRNSIATALVFAAQVASEPRPAPILFVHGAWHGGWCWEDHFVPYFANRGWQVRAINLRSHGGPRERRGLRWERVAHYVEDGGGGAGAGRDCPTRSRTCRRRPPQCRSRRWWSATRWAGWWCRSTWRPTPLP